MSSFQPSVGASGCHAGMVYLSTKSAFFPLVGLLYMAATGMVNAFELRPPKLAPRMSSSLKYRPQLISAFAVISVDRSAVEVLAAVHALHAFTYM